MSRFYTGNPIGSGSPLDLDDNAKNFDLAAISPEDTFLDRLKQTRLTYAGMESEFQSAQESRSYRFNNFIASSGYQFVGDYGPGIEFTLYNQLVRDENGEFWRVSGQVELPYTTTGEGVPEEDALVSVGDAVLRQDLSNPDKGAAMVAYVGPDGAAYSLADLADPTKGAWQVGYGGGSVGGALESIEQEIDRIHGGRPITPFDFGGVGDGSSDDTLAVMRCIEAAQLRGRAIDLRGGRFLVGELITMGVDIVSSSPGGALVAASGAATIIDVSGNTSYRWSDFTLDGALTTARAFRVTSAAHVEFSGVNLTRFASRAAFFEQSVLSAHIHGGVVSDCTAPDVYCYKASNGKFRDIHFRNCDEHAVRFGRFASDPVVIASNNSVTGCTFLNIGNDSVLYELSSRKGVVANNTYTNCRRIVKVEKSDDAQTQDIIVANNVFSTQIGVPGEVIKLLGVIRSVVKGNSISGGLMGITVGAQSQVANNYIRSIDDYGILYGNSCVVMGNVLDGVSGDGIRAEGSDSSRATITDNMLSSTVGGVGINAHGSDNVIAGNNVRSVGAAVRLISTSGNSIVTGNNFRGAGAVSNTSTGSVVTNNIT